MEPTNERHVAGGTDVPVAPDDGRYRVWNFTTQPWEDVPDRADQEAERAFAPFFEKSRVARLLFALNFDQENRLRALEGAQAVTKAVYRDALLARLKTL